jgi:predicted nucleotidyltransferase
LAIGEERYKPEVASKGLVTSCLIILEILTLKWFRLESQMMNRRDQFHAFVESRMEHLDEMGIESIGLFGSAVRDQDRPDSDLDVLVNFKPGRKTLDTFLELSELLEDHFKCEVDLMTPESLSRHFGPRIIAETEYVAIAS